MLKRSVLYGVFGLLVVVCVLLLAAPTLIRDFVEKRYPVKVRQVALEWPLRFIDVKVTTDSIRADLQEVKATPFGVTPTVWIRGGTVHVTKTDAKSAGTGQHTKILASHLYVMVDLPSMYATLNEVSIDEQHIKFQSGKITREDIELNLGSGSVTKDLQSITLTSADAEVQLPIHLPKVPDRGRLHVQNVKADRAGEVEAELLEYGPVRAEHLTASKFNQSYVGRVKSLVLNHPWVSLSPVSFSSIGFDVSLTRVDLAINQVRLHIDPKTFTVTGEEASCADWVEALPSPKPEALAAPPENWSGKFSFEFAKSPPKIQLNYDCKYKCSESPIKEIKSKLFKYEAYHPNGTTFERSVSAFSERSRWVDIRDVPPYITKAFITLEDPGFLGHRGIISQALQNSLSDNLKLGKFFRGGSTITQQLAKNLWLNRHKTISRKVYEAFLAMALESCLTKEEILELYMNVVEFGPDLYGIGDASKKYFTSDVRALTTEEGFYLASLLPHPMKALPPDQGGIQAAKNLMQHLVDGGKLPDIYAPDDDLPTPDWQTNE